MHTTSPNLIIVASTFLLEFRDTRGGGHHYPLRVK